MKNTYITIPVKYIPRFIYDKFKGSLVSEVLSYGVNFYADQIGADRYHVINHLIYSVYQNKLPHVIQDFLRYYDLEYLGHDDYYRGDFFNWEREQVETFEEHTEVRELLENDSALAHYATLFFKTSRALDKLGIINADIDHIMSAYSDLEKHKGEPHTTINTTQLFEFRDQKKSDKYRLQYATYLAIRSILGTKGYHNGVKYKLIFARLFGYGSANDIKMSHINGVKALKDIYERYYPKEGISPSNCPNRNRRRRLLKETCLGWNVHYYSEGIRGMDMSIEGKNGKDLIQLALDAEKRKKDNKIKRQRQAQEDAKQKALEMLKRAS